MYWLLHALLILGLSFAYLEWRNRGQGAQKSGEPPGKEAPDRARVARH